MMIRMYVADPPTTDLYASLVARVTQASMLLMFLDFSTLKLPFVFLTHLVASGYGSAMAAKVCYVSKVRLVADITYLSKLSTKEATNQLPSQLAI